MATHKIKFNRDECIGCGACVDACPSNWEMRDDNKSSPKKKVISDSEVSCNKEAADVCPLNLIEVEN